MFKNPGHTALSRKVVLQRCKCVRDNANSTLGGGSLLLVDRSSQCFRATEGKMTNTSIHGFSFLCTKHHEF